MAYYRSFPLGDGLIQIEDSVGTKLYLVLGEKSAALIDSGIGSGDIAAYVRTLTELPLSVILTHGHGDHAGGAGSFGGDVKVYLNSADLDVYRTTSADELRMHYYKKYYGANLSPLKKLQARLRGGSKPEWVPVLPGERLSSLNVGDCFDLGNEVLEICPGAGHTPGCVTVLFQKRRILLLGDALSGTTYLCLPESTGMRTFKQTLEDLKAKTDGKYDRVLSCHGRPGPGFTRTDLVDGALWLSEAILTGRDRHIAVNAEGFDCYSAKRMNGRKDDIGDHSSCNILYSEKRG